MICQDSRSDGLKAPTAARSVDRTTVDLTERVRQKSAYAGAWLKDALGG
jgi:hypothetical protein